MGKSLWGRRLTAVHLDWHTGKVVKKEVCVAFLSENQIKHVKARVKHPKTNGKVEKWFDLYEKFRSEFETFTDFVKWYNNIRFHESLDQNHFLQTPENAFWARLPMGSKLNLFLKRMEVEINVFGRI